VPHRGGKRDLSAGTTRHCSQSALCSDAGQGLQVPGPVRRHVPLGPAAAVTARQWRCHPGPTDTLSQKHYECFLVGEQGKADRLDTESEILHISARRADYRQHTGKHTEESRECRETCCAAHLPGFPGVASAEAELQAGPGADPLLTHCRTPEQPCWPVPGWQHFPGRLAQLSGRPGRRTDAMDATGISG